MNQRERDSMLKTKFEEMQKKRKIGLVHNNSAHVPKTQALRPRSDQKQPTNVN